MIKVEVKLKGKDEKKVAQQIQRGIYEAIADADYIAVNVCVDEVADVEGPSVINLDALPAKAFPTVPADRWINRMNRCGR